MNIKKVVTKGNREIEVVTLKNNNVELVLLDVGATIYSLKTKDKDGKLDNIVLNYQDLDKYFGNESYFGTTVGRIAGRIPNGVIKLNGKSYNINKKRESDINVLHSGKGGISFKKFNIEVLSDTKVKFSLLQKSEDDGFPADVNIDVIYELKDNEVVIEYHAIANQDSVLNLTNHSYFNLSGNIKRTIVDSYLKMPIKKYFRTDEKQLAVALDDIPSDMDFTKLTKISDKIENDFYQKNVEKGIDHILLVDANDKTVLEDEISGRKLEVTSSYPVMVVYTTNYPDGSILENGQQVRKYDGICFESQYAPLLDTDNYDNSLSKLKKGDKFNNFIKLSF